MIEHYLHPLFKPRSIAIFGASEKPGSVGGVTLNNLINYNYKGNIYPLNPKHEQVYGLPVFSSLKMIPGHVDVAIIATPAETVADIIEECGRKGVKAIVIMAGGFSVQQSGKRERVWDVINGQYRLQSHNLYRRAKRYGMMVLGPNSLGLINPRNQLNASYSLGQAKPGRLALISQSGALITAILDWADSNNVGFSNIVSIGQGLDLDFSEVLDYLVTDPETDSILLYIEGIHDSRRFMSALRAAARVKPIIVMKAGIEGDAAKAVETHIGTPPCRDEAFIAALERAGVVRVRHFSNFFAVAKTLSSGVRSRGERIAIISNSGSAGIIATDALQADQFKIQPLPNSVKQDINKLLPHDWSGMNPIDIGGFASSYHFTQATKFCLDHDDFDAALVILTPQTAAEPEKTAQQIAELSRHYAKPILCCWMGESLVKNSYAILNQHNIPNYRTPEAAIEGFRLITTFTRNQRLLMQVPAPTDPAHLPDMKAAKSILKNAIEKKQSALNQAQTSELLHIFDIPYVTSYPVNSKKALKYVTKETGLPCVLKLDAPNVEYKTDVGGIMLNIKDLREAALAFDEIQTIGRKHLRQEDWFGISAQAMKHNAAGRELMIAMINDPVFGPVIQFGSGGTHANHLNDYAYSLPPLNTFLAKNLIRATFADQILDKYRNFPPANRALLEDLLVHISTLICELPQISSLVFDPVIVDDNEIYILDAKIKLKTQWQRSRRYIPYDHMAIHPYPNDLINHITLKTGERLLVRPIRPEDAVLEQNFTRQLSQKSRYSRFMFSLRELTPQMLNRLTQIDYDREMALIALCESSSKDSINASKLEVATARYAINPDQVSAEFAIVVADEWQNKGIAKALIQCLLKTAQKRGIQTINGQVFHDNAPMLYLLEKIGFEITQSKEDKNIMEARFHVKPI